MRSSHASHCVDNRARLAAARREASDRELYQRQTARPASLWSLPPQRIVLGLLKRIQFNVGVQIRPVELTRAQLLRRKDLFDSGVRKNGLVRKRHKIFGVIRDKPKPLRRDASDRTGENADPRQTRNRAHVPSPHGRAASYADTSAFCMNWRMGSEVKYK
jgi:hypothetical protein